MKTYLLLIYSIMCTIVLYFSCKNDWKDKQFNLNEIAKVEFPPYHEVYRTIKKYRKTGDYSVIIRYEVTNKNRLKSLLGRLDKEVSILDSKWFKEFNRYIFEQEKDDNEYFKIIIEENSERYFDIEYGRQKYPPFKYFKHKSRGENLGFCVSK